MKIITNNVPRDVLYAHELTPDERKEFDYLDWDKLEKGEDSASFFRYKGQLYDLGDGFESTNQYGRPVSEDFVGWDAYQSDSFFSGILIKWAGDGGDRYDYIIVGRYYT